VSRRRYDATGRRQAAAANRHAMLDAARTLFADRGYAATTVAEIAAAAGVAPATVNAAFGGKAGLLKQLVDIAVAGDEEPVRLADRPVTAAIAAEPDPSRACDLLASLVTDIHGRLGSLHHVVQQAAGTDPQVRAHVDREQRGRREGMAEFVATLDPAHLAPGLTADRAADTVWALTDPHLYTALVQERGWTTTDYRHWLANQLTAALLSD